MRRQRYIVMSPNGLPAYPRGFATLAEAEKAKQAFVNRYRMQGYYAGIYERIPIEELHNYVEIIDEGNPDVDLSGFGDDFTSRSHEEIVREMIRLEREVESAPTLTARRKALVQLKRLNAELRRGTPTGGAVVVRSTPALQVDPVAAWEEARQAGRQAYATQYDGFPCGLVELVTGDKSFAKVLFKHGEPDLFISRDALRKSKWLHGYGFSVSGRQGIAPKEAFCHAAVEVLKKYGIDVWCHVAWD